MKQMERNTSAKREAAEPNGDKMEAKGNQMAPNGAKRRPIDAKPRKSLKNIYKGNQNRSRYLKRLYFFWNVDDFFHRFVH